MKRLLLFILTFLVAGCSTIALNYPNRDCNVSAEAVRDYVQREYGLPVRAVTPASFAEVNRLCGGGLRIACGLVGCTTAHKSVHLSSLTGLHLNDIRAHETFHQMEFLLAQATGRLVFDEARAVRFGRDVAQKLCR